MNKESSKIKNSGNSEKIYEVNNQKSDKTNKRNKSDNANNNISKIVKSYLNFYRENLKFSHIVITIIMIILFVIMLNFSITKLQMSNESIAEKVTENYSIIDSIFKEKIALSAIIVFSGITPFVFLPVIGILYSYSLADEISQIYFLNKSVMSAIIGSIGAVIQIVGIAIAICAGVHFCIQSTKRFIYSNQKGFGLKDVKKYIYRIRNDEKKIEKFNESENEKAKKREKLNVKINYINLILSFILSIIVLSVGAFITYIAK